jgi:hypothetical protein
MCSCDICICKSCQEKLKYQFIFLLKRRKDQEYILKMLLKVKQAIKRNIEDKVKIDRLKEKKEKGQKERKEKVPYRKSKFNKYLFQQYSY